MSNLMSCVCVLNVLFIREDVIMISKPKARSPTKRKHKRCHFSHNCLPHLLNSIRSANWRTKLAASRHVHLRCRWSLPPKFLPRLPLDRPPRRTFLFRPGKRFISVTKDTTLYRPLVISHLKECECYCFSVFLTYYSFFCRCQALLSKWTFPYITKNIVSFFETRSMHRTTAKTYKTSEFWSSFSPQHRTHKIYACLATTWIVYSIPTQRIRNLLCILRDDRIMYMNLVCHALTWNKTVQVRVPFVGSIVNLYVMTIVGASIFEIIYPIVVGRFLKQEWHISPFCHCKL